MPRSLFAWFLLLGMFFGLGQAAVAELRVGAAKVDVTPEQLPVLINGGMTSRSANQVVTHVYARAIVMDDGKERIGIVVVDSCMVPRHLCDEAKQLAATRTQLKPDRILISATHTHTAPSSMGALGTNADSTYVPFLRQKVAEALVAAEARLEPAEVGWGSGQAPQFTALRRWVRRPDRIAVDPFGNPTVRATMHAARNPDDAIGPTGPEDPELPLIAFRSKTGKPIAVLANFSMHYFGSVQPISADYFGLFCEGFEQAIGASSSSNKTKSENDVVAVMSHGCSGDIWRHDYMQTQPEAEGTIEEFSLGLLSVAKAAYDHVQYQPDADLAMEETRLPMRYRVPDAQRLAWAREVVETMGDRLPQTQPEIYAREQLILHELQSTEIVTQAIRIGTIGIATTPNETYALTGLKLKMQSPLAHTMVIELANGGDGYIPPPEQHGLGGYNTWAARSAGLEVTAEPRIVAANLRMLEQVSKKPRRAIMHELDDAAEAILSAKPTAFWRLDEHSPPTASDRSGNNRTGYFESGVVFFLEGPQPADAIDAPTNRCPHFAGGRMVAELNQLGPTHTVILSFWNGMPLDVRDVTGWMLSHDYPNTTTSEGVHLGLDRTGRLLLQIGDARRATGKTVISRWQWAKVAMVVTPDHVQVFLGDSKQPEIDLKRESTSLSGTWFFGGRSDNEANWEGRLDEIAIFDRAIDLDELY